MFGYGYKEDALKWREHQKKIDDAALAKVAKMVSKVHLRDGEVLDYELECNGRLRNFGFLDDDWRVVPAEERINDVYKYMCQKSNDDGLYIDGSFYPSSQIKRIERGEIEVTTNEQ